ncbi:nuclear transport factor 2 family protein [Paraflavitalea sp. CAU 1676]|uniref:nuclear transport factor 2 family protein n=1 Tax=Paraflavitalea sp. CAU 1676 TaxID=3032598 RepID=UPI0023DCC894|nr:nuclear transport factor 2 family protein [Paraflavitalea sp. CAU 1676]MDF2190070.1 nuclear transport factor 2 family protein [Paraflavitalea sp. CAU 1676]
MKCILSTLLLMAAIFINPIHSLAQTNPEEAGVKACLENYMSGDGNRMEKAFHPSASMKYVDFQTGEYKDVPIADFLARIKANTSKPDRKVELLSLNIEGTAAQAKIKLETGQAIMYDYMNLLKIGGEWKIVSKIFSRQK